MKKIQNKLLLLHIKPIDFDDLPFAGIRDIDYDELMDSGIKRIGFVFNLDENWQSGSHWVALFSNLKKNYVISSELKK